MNSALVAFRNRTKYFYVMNNQRIFQHRANISVAAIFTVIMTAKWQSELFYYRLQPPYPLISTTDKERASAAICGCSLHPPARTPLIPTSRRLC
jgi:hypothetical protein